MPPVMINDLSATLYEHDHLVHLTFTAPGDDEQEGVSQNYEIRTAATASGFEKFREDFFEGDLIPADFYVTQKLFRYFFYSKIFRPFSGICDEYFLSNVNNPKRAGDLERIVLEQKKVSACPPNQIMDFLILGQFEKIATEN